MNDQLDQWVKEAQASATQFDNDWDIDAVMWNDLGSFVRGTRGLGMGEIRDIFEVLGVLQVENIDLALVNIEGYEYILLPYMMAKNIKPQKLLIQFHNYDGRNREQETRELLVKSGYDVLWDYGTVLSAWELET